MKITKRELVGTLIGAILYTMIAFLVTTLTGCVFTSAQDDDTTAAWEFPCDSDFVLSEDGECVPEPWDSCSTSERRLYDNDGDGWGNPNYFIQIGVCEP